MLLVKASDYFWAYNATPPWRLCKQHLSTDGDGVTVYVANSVMNSDMDYTNEIFRLWW
jgi:hypothetical protein